MNEQVKARKDKFKPGTRIEIVTDFDDPFVHMPEGLQGTVLRVDDIGTVHAKWDNGKKLGATLEDDIMLI